MDLLKLPVVEGALLDLVMGRQDRTSGGTVPTRSIKERLLALQGLAAGGGGSYGETALERELDELRRASSGTRNHALNKAAFSLHQIAQEGHLDPSEVDERLRSTALEIGLGGHEIEQTLGSARQGASARPRSADRLPSIDSPGSGNRPASVSPGQGRSGGVRLAAAAYREPGESIEGEDIAPFLARLQQKTYTLEQVEHLPDPVPLVDECLMKDSLVVLWGPPASKKSFLAIDIGMCIATGTWWHGRRVAQGGVLHFAGEGAHGIKNRVAAWMEEEGITLSGLAVAAHRAELQPARPEAVPVGTSAHRATGPVPSGDRHDGAPHAGRRRERLEGLGHRYRGARHDP